MDKPRSHRAAMTVIGNADRQETGRWLNNRAENYHLLFRGREGAILRFRRAQTLQKCVWTHTPIHNHLNHQRHLYSRAGFKLNRAAALAKWRQLLRHTFSLSLQLDAGSHQLNSARGT